jgi:hypothetical protein
MRSAGVMRDRDGIVEVGADGGSGDLFQRGESGERRDNNPEGLCGCRCPGVSIRFFFSTRRGTCRWR